jgi:hypothetical protein
MAPVTASLLVALAKVLSVKCMFSRVNAAALPVPLRKCLRVKLLPVFSDTGVLLWFSLLCKTGLVQNVNGL